MSALALGTIAADSLPESIFSTPCQYFTQGATWSNRIAITVDDGWFPEKVEKMCKMASECDVPISAFPVGKVVQNSPDLWLRMVKDGVELFNHTMDHRNLGDEEVDAKRQILDWERTYQGLGVGEYKNKIIRLPRNNGVDTRLFKIVTALGYVGIAGWTMGSKGYMQSYTVEKVMEDLLPNLRGGSIILLHFVDTDIAALPYIAKILHERKLRPVKLSELPGTPVYQQ